MTIMDTMIANMLTGHQEGVSIGSIRRGRRRSLRGGGRLRGCRLSLRGGGPGGRLWTLAEAAILLQLRDKGFERLRDPRRFGSPLLGHGPDFSRAKEDEA